MEEPPLLSLSTEQISGLKLNIEKIDKLLKNSAALIDAGAFTQRDVDQMKQTRDIAQRTLDAFSTKNTAK